MGPASPVRPSGEPCWDAALATDTSTKAASRATVGPVCSALLCMESALWGNTRDEQCVKQKAARVLRPPSGGSVWPPIRNPWARRWRLADRTAHPSAIHPYQSGIGDGLALCPLLCSGGSDSRYQGRLFTQRISSYTHNDPIAPACLANQPLRSTTNRQGVENELTVSLVRHLHFTLHMRPETALFHPQITELTEIQWRRLYIFFNTKKARWQKNRSNTMQMWFNWKWLRGGCVYHTERLR